MVFDWPDTARFLNHDERIRMRRRLAIDGLRNANEQYDKRHIYAAAKDWKCWAYAFIYMGCLCPLYAFSLFLPTILAGMGYSGTRAQLLTVPPYAVAATLTIFIGWLGDRTRQRGILNMIVVSIGIIGFCMLIGSSEPRIQYAGTFLVRFPISKSAYKSRDADNLTGRDGYLPDHPQHPYMVLEQRRGCLQARRDRRHGGGMGQSQWYANLTCH